MPSHCRKNVTACLLSLVASTTYAQDTEQQHADPHAVAVTSQEALPLKSCKRLRMFFSKFVQAT